MKSKLENTWLPEMVVCCSKILVNPSTMFGDKGHDATGPTRSEKNNKLFLMSCVSTCPHITKEMFLPLTLPIRSTRGNYFTSTVQSTLPVRNGLSEIYCFIVQLMPDCV